MIFRTGDVENGTGNVREIYRPPTQFDLSFHQFVLLVELENPLLKGSTGEWYTVVHPFIHSQPGVHGLVLHDAIPHRNIGTDIVGDRFEHTISGIDEFRWNIAKRFYHKIGIEVLLAGPYPEQSHIVWREIDGSGEENQVPERLIMEECRIHGCHCPTHAVA